MHIVANDSEFDIDENTPLLQALQQHGIAANFSCRNGNCGLCEARLNAGSVWLEDSQQLIDAPTAVLLCRAFARCDLNLKIKIASRAISRYCRVLRMERKDSGAYEVDLQLPAGRIPELQADEGIQLEDRTNSRIIKAVSLGHRVLTLQVVDDDVEWLNVLKTGGVRIVMPVAPVSLCRVADESVDPHSSSHRQ